MFKFFASLRVMLAREFANIVLGAIAQDAIKKLIIPDIEKALANAGDDREATALQERLNEWILLSDPRTHEAGVWNALAAKVIRGEVRAHHRGEADIEDIAGMIAEAFLKKPRMMRTTFEKLDPLRSTPKDAQRVWNRAINKHTKFVLRTWATMAHLQHGTDDYDPLANMESQIEKPLDKEVYKELERDLVRFMGKALRDNTSKMLFKEWHKIAKSKGPGKVVLKKDVYPVLWDKGVEVKEGRLSELWRNITRIMVLFWETPVEDGGAGVRVTDRMKKKLKVSMVLRIAEDAWRERICSWMLSAVKPTLRS